MQPARAGEATFIVVPCSATRKRAVWPFRRPILLGNRGIRWNLGPVTALTNVSAPDSLLNSTLATGYSE